MVGDGLAIGSTFGKQSRASSTEEVGLLSRHRCCVVGPWTTYIHSSFKKTTKAYVYFLCVWYHNINSPIFLICYRTLLHYNKEYKCFKRYNKLRQTTFDYSLKSPSLFSYFFMVQGLSFKNTALLWPRSPTDMLTWWVLSQLSHNKYGLPSYLLFFIFAF